MHISPSLPDFTARALAALSVGKLVYTDRASLFRVTDRPADITRPFVVRLVVSGRETRHASPALAVAFLRSL